MSKKAVLHLFKLGLLMAVWPAQELNAQTSSFGLNGQFSQGEQSQKLGALTCPTGDAQMDLEQRRCSGRAGMQWNCRLNRCFTSGEGEAFQQDYQQCLNEKDPETRKGCHDQLAKAYAKYEGMDLLKDADDKLEFLSKGVYAAQLAHLIMAFTVSKASSTCNLMKFYIGVSLLGLGNEVLHYFSLKDKVREIEKKFASQNVLADGYDQQLRSFEALEKIHREIAGVANRKSNMYATNMAGYGAVAAVAFYQSTLAASDPCGMDPAGAEGDTSFLPHGHNLISALPADIFQLPTLLFPNAIAQDNSPNMTNFLPVMGQMLMALNNPGTNAGVDASKKKVFSYLRSSPTIGILASIQASIAGVLFVKFRKIKKQAQRNATEIKAIAQEFMALATANCGKNRDNPQTPQCYCYYIDGGVNPDHDDERVCREYFDSFFTKALATTDYNASQTAAPKGCISNNTREIDPACQCKKTNSCFQLPVDTSSFGALGTNLAANTLAELQQKLASGELDMGRIDPQKMQKQAKRNVELAKKIRQKIPSSLAKPKSPVDALLAARKSSINSFHKIFPAKTLDNFRQLAGNKNLSLGPSNLFAKTSQKVSKRKRRYRKGTGLNTPKKLAKVSSLNNFSFGLKKGKNTSSKNKIQTFGSKSYKIDDIHSEGAISIWDIISTRYKRSGFK